jgi:hypothetical protein
MYAQEGDIELREIISRAKREVIAQDRHHFMPVLRAIEEYAHDNDMIIGGTVGVYATCGISVIDNEDADLWILELYAEEIEEKMRGCVRYLAQTLQHLASRDEADPARIYLGDTRTILLRTAIADREYRLVCDYRMVAIGFSLGMRKGISITETIEAARIPRAPFGSAKSVLLMPISAQIMRVAHFMYDPLQSKKWVSAHLPLLAQLFVILKNRVTSVVGAYVEPRDGIDLDCPYALIGERAIAYYMGTKPKARAQYLCSFEDIDDWLADHQYVGRYADVRAPYDFRYRKLVVHDKRDAIIADLFNALSFEPVPINEMNGIAIAAPFCVLHFLYLDIWALSFVARILQGDARNSLVARRAYLIKLGAQFFDWIVNQCEPEMMFPAKYIGIYASKTEALLGAQTRKKASAPFSVLDSAKLVQLGKEIVARIEQL